MFGLSLVKLLATAALIIFGWYLVKLLARRMAGPLVDKRPKKAARAGHAEVAAEDMIQCPVCGMYMIARAAADCGRKDCPYR